jgi:hypothetical protein
MDGESRIMNSSIRNPQSAIRNPQSAIPMCCFTGNVTFVQNTRIFARMIDAGRQGLVYQMNVGAPAELAMILPLPVAADVKEDSVTFIDLSGYPKFFAHLRAAFPVTITRGEGSIKSLGPSPASQTLKIHAEEEFDHTLYCQVRRTGLFAMTRWEESSGHARATCNIELSKGLLAADLHLHRQTLVGSHKNEDILLGTA